VSHDFDQTRGPSADRTPRTRTGATWFGICVAALLLVVLMHGNLPLAMALPVAAVGAAIVTIVIGAARITPLRRLSRRQNR
jgi:uncharacterized integral membrane protein